MLHTRLQEALEMKTKHRSLLNRFTVKLSPDIVQQWMDMIDAWEGDHTRPNPYEEPRSGASNFSTPMSRNLKHISGTTMAQVRLKFAQEELEEAKKGIEPLHEITTNAFIQVGLELEEQQYVADFGLASLCV